MCYCCGSSIYFLLSLSRSCYIVDVVFVTFIHSKILPIKTEGMDSYIEDTRSVGVQYVSTSSYF